MDTSNKHIWHITYPILMTLLSQNIINVTDTAFLGHIGEIELGAAAIGGIFYIAIFMIGFGFSLGSQILIGRRNGEKNQKEIGLIFNNGLIFNFILGCLFLLFSLFFTSDLLGGIVHSEKIYDSSMEYLNIRIWGIPFAFVSVMFRALFVGITNTKVLTFNSIITGVINIIFDYVLIFGKFGFPKMGIEGAAFASVLAEIASLLHLIIFTMSRTNHADYDIFKFKYNFRVIKMTLKISIYIMFQHFISVSTWFLFFLFIERTGERQLAVSNIARSIYTLLMIPATALGTTTGTIISNLIGEKKENEVLPFIKKMNKLNLLMVMPFLLIIFISPEIFLKIYSSDTLLIEASMPVIKVLSFSLLFFGVGIILFNAVSSTGNTKMALYIELIALIFYIGYTYYTTQVMVCDVSVVWIAEYIYWLIVAILGYIYIKNGKWKKLKI